MTTKRNADLNDNVNLNVNLNICYSGYEQDIHMNTGKDVTPWGNAIMR